MNTHTSCFCPLLRKLLAFEILTWANESQWTKQRTLHPISPVKYNLYFHCSENTTFLYFHGCELQLLFKYALYLINSFLYQFGPQHPESVQKNHSDLSRTILVSIITNINQLYLSALVSELLQALLSKINKLLL